MKIKRIKIQADATGAKKEESATYTADDLHAAAQKARIEERTKLHDRIEALEAKLGNAGSDDVDAERLAAIRLQVEKENATEMKKLQRKVNALSEENLSRKVQEIKAIIVEEYGGQVIPSLIRGDDEEELRASAEAAHDEWLETMAKAGIEVTDEDEAEEDDADATVEDDSNEDAGVTDAHVEKFKQNGRINKSQPVIKQKLQDRVVRRVPVVPVPGDRGGVRRSDPDANLRGVKSMTPTEYRANRSTIMNAVRQRYANGQGAFTR